MTKIICLRIYARNRKQFHKPMHNQKVSLQKQENDETNKMAGKRVNDDDRAEQRPKDN